MADKELSLDDQLKQQELEFKRLQLENLRYQVENERARRAQILRAHLAQQKALDDANEQIKAQQSVCKHRKGGKNLDGIVNGHDSNYSVIKHMYAWGELGVMCSRCGKEWRQPKPEDFGKTKEGKEEFKEAVRVYTEAVNFPTDNEPSGTQLFVITKRQAA